jgi:hypothetical protein
MLIDAKMGYSVPQRHSIGGTIVQVFLPSAMADTQINHQDALDYWQSIDADVNGMLGGFPYISKVDLQGSKNFLAKLGIGGKVGDKVKRAVDCGAG